MTIEEVIIFKQECLLGISIGIEILGRLLYCIYDKSSNSFDTHKVSQLALIDWSRDNELWLDNAVRIDSKNENSAKNYIVFGASAVSDAVKIIKLKLGW